MAQESGCIAKIYYSSWQTSLWSTLRAGHSLIARGYPNLLSLPHQINGWCEVGPGKGTECRDPLEQRYHTLGRQGRIVCIAFRLTVTWSVHCYYHALLKNMDFIKHYMMPLHRLGPDQMAAILYMTFTNAFSRMEAFVFWLKYHWKMCSLEC